MAIHRKRPSGRIVPVIPLALEKRAHAARNSISGLPAAASAETTPHLDGAGTDNQRVENGIGPHGHQDTWEGASRDNGHAVGNAETPSAEPEVVSSRRSERCDSGIASRATSSPCAQDRSTASPESQDDSDTTAPTSNGNGEARSAVNGTAQPPNATSVPEQGDAQLSVQQDLPVRVFPSNAPLVFGGRPESPLDPSTVPPARFTGARVFAPAFVPSSAPEPPAHEIPSATPNGTVLTPTSIPFIPNNAVHAPIEHEAFAGAPMAPGLVTSAAHSADGPRTMSPSGGPYAMPPVPTDSYTDLSLLYHDQDKLHRWSSGAAKNSVPYPETALNQLAARPGEYADFEHMSLMRASILNMFGNDVLTDYMLVLYDARLDRPFMTFPLHSIIVSQSPTLARLLLSSQAPFNPYERMKPLRATINDAFVTPHAFTDALRYVYGARPLTLDDLSRTWDPYGNLLEHTNPVEVFSRCLAYFAAGYILQLPTVCLHGIAYAKSLLSVDTLALAFDFAYARREPKPSAAHPLGGFAYGAYNKDFLAAIVDFLIAALPVDFAFDPQAPELPGNMQRFPALPTAATPPQPHHARSRTGSRNVRLGGIQFGQATADALFSSVLLTVPFRTLKQVCEAPEVGKRLGAERARALADAVVGERERRRALAVKIAEREGLSVTTTGGHHRGGSRKGGHGGKWASPGETVRLTERVETARDGAGFMLTRRE